jgi:large subunit ribosomal protein L21e
MVKASKGMRHGTRRKLRKRPGEKFKTERFIQEFKPGDKVIIKQNPSSHRMPHPVFMGRTGEVKKRRGRAYVIEISAGNRPKKLIVRPEHLKKL